MPKGQAWHSRGLVHTLLAQSMTQEADVLHALARVMHEGERAGQLACLLPASVLRVHVGQLREKRVCGLKRAGSKRAGPQRLACEVVRVAQFLRRYGAALRAEYSEAYGTGSGRALTVEELQQKHAIETAQLTQKCAVLEKKATRAANCARAAKSRTHTRVRNATARAKRQLEAAKKNGTEARKQIEEGARESAKQTRE